MEQQWAGFQCSSASRKFLNCDTADKQKPRRRVSVLFSEPKIPQFNKPKLGIPTEVGFSALQRAENSSMVDAWASCAHTTRVSVLFSEPKIPQSSATIPLRLQFAVSVLFSEPKIPQFACTLKRLVVNQRFQCSSASRKFLNLAPIARRCPIPYRFSALQRAENSSIPIGSSRAQYPPAFQCSSASRKFLNLARVHPIPRRDRCFSALQRAENSSIVQGAAVAVAGSRFQCSSASRKFLNAYGEIHRYNVRVVSVLFSEPKIPQFDAGAAAAHGVMRFSALQRAENSSILLDSRSCAHKQMFQCSSASRKFLNPRRQPDRRVVNMFQCSSASRKFLNQNGHVGKDRTVQFQCSSASRKFLNRLRTCLFSHL